MPQLFADVSAHGKFGLDCCATDRTHRDTFGGRAVSHPGDTRRFSSPGFLRHTGLPYLHDLDAMSDASLWTMLSNFSMPHFLSGARLRRSKRHVKR